MTVLSLVEATFTFIGMYILGMLVGLPTRRGATITGPEFVSRLLDGVFVGVGLFILGAIALVIAGAG